MTASTPYAQVLRHASLPWLLAVVFVTAAPHALHQPVWLVTAAAGVLAAVLWQWRRGYKVTQPWLKILLVSGGLVGILLHYRPLIDYEAGIALLILMLALKLLELKSRRDAVIVVTLAHFLLLTHFFYSQSIVTAAWLVLGLLVVIAALVRLYEDPERPGVALLVHASRLLVQAMPFMVLLYLFFPRINGPLWGLPQEKLIARTGLTDSINPGSIAELAMNDEIAFRVQFHNQVPLPRQLYWRGPVMGFYDGMAWRGGYSVNIPPELERRGNPIIYTLTLEPHNQNWILAMEMTPRPPEVEDGMRMRINNAGVLTSFQPITSRKRFTFASYPDYRLDAQASTTMRRTNLQLPRGLNPRASALAKGWLGETRDPRQLANRAVAWFRQGGFRYTLEPQVLGQHAVDDFLFETRGGFCEHYASAFVWLMRAAGVPARIVAGYHGGEFNAGYFVVRQSDAHAWAEIWVENEGWLRVDPTAAVPPEMTDESVRNLAAATQSDDWLIALRNRWEAIGNHWNQWVLGYNPAQQYDFLSALGLRKPTWRSLSAVLIMSMTLCLLLLVAWVFRPGRETDPARRIWRQACRRLEKYGIVCPPWESPHALSRRLETEAPHVAPAVRRLATLVCAARYGNGNPPANAVLRAALKSV
ncbi:MAG: DUF3488 and transglutaminase-like domain-containing protein [Zoogloeaceae bacterium]|jgi:transglutaminase-like putative cysteine protease|nr:DUF3488 and transglutaminase-like domain-containing protein [Zoogloeaceae bacterium]